MKLGRFLAFAVALAAAVASESGNARADSPPDTAAAQVLFEAGRALVHEKRFSEACPKFAESLRLDRGLGTMLWLADCYENNGQSASAWAQFKEAAAAAALHKDAREHVAARRAAALETKLSKLQLAAPPDGAVPGLEVRRDGVLVGPSEITLPVPVDPGIHTIAATAPGRKAWSSTIEVPTRPGLLSVTVPVLEVEAEPAPAAPAVAAAPAQPRPPRDTARARRIAGLATGGVGVVALGVGAYLGLDAKSRYGSVSCPNDLCSQSGKQTRNGAISEANASTALFVLGGAAIAAGVIVFFTAPKPLGTVGLAPMVGPQSAGLMLVRRFE